MRFVTFGEIMLRLTPPGADRLAQALPGRLDALFGGAEANVAVALAALGAEASFLTVLPEGPLGDACLAALRARGVEASAAVRSPRGRLGIYFLEAGAACRPAAVIYDRSESSFALAGPGEVPWEAALAGAGWLHLSGIGPAVSRTAAALAAEGLDRAEALGVPVSLDLNYRARLWSWEPETRPEELARRVMGPLAARAAILLGNEEDAHRVLGLSVRGLDLAQGRLEPEAYEGLARQTARLCPRARFVAFSLRQSEGATRNRWGGVLLDVASDRVCFQPRDADGRFAPLLIDPVVDRVGSGDAFAAGLLHGLRHRRLLPEEALGLAVAAGALAHTERGDWLLSSAAEVEALARGDRAGRIRR